MTRRLVRLSEGCHEMTVQRRSSRRSPRPTPYCTTRPPNSCPSRARTRSHGVRYVLSHVSHSPLGLLLTPMMAHVHRNQQWTDDAARVMAARLAALLSSPHSDRDIAMDVDVGATTMTKAGTKEGWLVVRETTKTGRSCRAAGHCWGRGGRRVRLACTSLRDQVAHLFAVSSKIAR